MNGASLRKRLLQVISPTIIVLWLLALVCVVRSVGFFSFVAGGISQNIKPSMMICSGKNGRTMQSGIHDEQAVLQIAGTGSAVPIARLMAQGFMEAHPGRRVNVHDSIGSTGGIKATQAGDIDIGLISRPLKPGESGKIRVFPFASVAVVVAVNVSVEEEDVTAEELNSIYRGDKLHWKNGLPVVVLQRERGDSSHGVINKVIKGFADINFKAHQTGKWRVVFKDHLMIKALASTPGAVGITDTGLVRLDNSNLIKVLKFEGVAPEEDSIGSGQYPFLKTLSFILKAGENNAPALDFIRFAQSDKGRAILENAGYIPESLKKD